MTLRFRFGVFVAFSGEFCSIKFVETGCQSADLSETARNKGGNVVSFELTSVIRLYTILNCLVIMKHIHIVCRHIHCIYRHTAWAHQSGMLEWVDGGSWPIDDRQISTTLVLKTKKFLKLRLINCRSYYSFIFCFFPFLSWLRPQ